MPRVNIYIYIPGETFIMVFVYIFMVLKVRPLKYCRDSAGIKKGTTGILKTKKIVEGKLWKIFQLHSMSY